MTEQQRKALHLYFRWLAEALREKDFDFRDLTVEIPATEYMVKELMFKPIIYSMYGKNSTMKLENNEVSQAYDVLHRALIEKLDVNVPFPDEEDLARDEADRKFYGEK